MEGTYCYAVDILSLLYNLCDSAHENTEITAQISLQ